MATVSVNGRSVGYEESGSGEPLILVHGGQSDRYQFDLFRPLLGDGIRAIAYDQRDTRENIYEDVSPYTIHDLAQDCVDFLAAMGIEKIDFIWYLKRIGWLALIGYFAGAIVYILQAGIIG